MITLNNKQMRINAGNNFINMQLKIGRLEAEVKRKEFKIRELKKTWKKYNSPKTQNLHSIFRAFSEKTLDPSRPQGGPAVVPRVVLSNDKRGFSIILAIIGT